MGESEQDDANLGNEEGILAGLRKTGIRPSRAPPASESVASSALSTQARRAKFATYGKRPGDKTRQLARAMALLDKDDSSVGIGHTRKNAQGADLNAATEAGLIRRPIGDID
jgi:hypothetical protein